MSLWSSVTTAVNGPVRRAWTREMPGVRWPLFGVTVRLFGCSGGGRVMAERNEEFGQNWRGARRGMAVVGRGGEYEELKIVEKELLRLRTAEQFHVSLDSRPSSRSGVHVKEEFGVVRAQCSLATNIFGDILMKVYALSGSELSSYAQTQSECVRNAIVAAARTARAKYGANALLDTQICKANTADPLVWSSTSTHCMVYGTAAIIEEPSLNTVKPPATAS